MLLFFHVLRAYPIISNGYIKRLFQFEFIKFKRKITQYSFQILKSQMEKLNLF
jgi:hypothetical protein